MQIRGSLCANGTCVKTDVRCAGWLQQRPTLLCGRSVTATMSGLPRPQSMRSSLASTKNVDPADLYIKLDRIGKGSFGEVYKG